MQDVLAMTYLWLKAGHIIFVIFWIAGLFMLPRLFVYHQEATAGSEEAARFAEREKKLLKIILLPSIIVVWVLGIALAITLDAWSQGWLHAKLLLVLILSGYHGYMSAYAKKLARGERPLSGKALRLLNEVPGITVALIVILVIVKPF
ncbi:protoporphyrinogen oxidase HemJ [Aurantiacibacter poecillastricola]|uniref:protoporphyrinogen oxidase HemJ n=1 Tax=Aurantiacibacter poecillastricola TaxID=3064385 RepID=UPI00273DA31D|nr:protoporphyrinogen oxidase HemJ [Aurantiacibacter sp. 219JJ12-13]MDP5260505.1 protoporphyrinogen oxidase HemJ [Aurantiacibacter sp. 219JJ12-13]